jgi:hypothetical protein
MGISVQYRLNGAVTNPPSLAAAVILPKAFGPASSARLALKPDWKLECPLNARITIVNRAPTIAITNSTFCTRKYAFRPSAKMPTSTAMSSVPQMNAPVGVDSLSPKSTSPWLSVRTPRLRNSGVRP